MIQRVRSEGNVSCSHLLHFVPIEERPARKRACETRIVRDSLRKFFGFCARSGQKQSAHVIVRGAALSWWRKPGRTARDLLYDFPAPLAIFQLAHAKPQMFLPESAVRTNKPSREENGRLQAATLQLGKRIRKVVIPPIVKSDGAIGTLPVARSSFPRGHLIERNNSIALHNPIEKIREGVFRCAQLRLKALRTSRKDTMESKDRRSRAEHPIRRPFDRCEFTQTPCQSIPELCVSCHVV